jgi:hypothetical protein
MFLLLNFKFLQGRTGLITFCHNDDIQSLAFSVILAGKKNVLDFSQSSFTKLMHRREYKLYIKPQAVMITKQMMLGVGSSMLWDLQKSQYAFF